MTAVARAAKSDPDFYRAFRSSMSADPRVAARGVVEMTLLTIRAGEAWLPEYLPLPAHLSDDPKWQRALVISEVKADAQMRSDLIAWAQENRGRQDRAAKALENLVRAIREADAVLADPDDTDEELAAWVDELRGHAAMAYSVDPAGAPGDKQAVEAWAWAACELYQPTAAWLMDNQQSRSAFVPRTKRATSTSSMFNRRPRNDAEQGED